MSANLKDSMREELQKVCDDIGEPDLLDKIPDGRSATTVEDLLAFLEDVGHPSLTMDPLF
jgi:CO dehydrogenase/acetyl-CoA synthase beta subunit